ncbi:MAG: biotin--[acetyl-CoA-carboxylase] ligase [Bacteroidetes bacterium]|nr:MAG: biotin--[acetyl-CoA-carboxylase] ligase [Bacteroidota bacterium]
MNKKESKILRFEHLESTNSKARELLKNSELDEGSIIICNDQSAGRGYGTNAWESAPEKNLTATWILKPSFLTADRQFWLTKVLSLAVRDTVIHFHKGNLPVTIKWPNDVYVGNSKISGILVENNIFGNNIQVTVAGVGLNVNQEEFYSDIPNPVSLKQLIGKDTDLEHCLEILNDRIFYYYNLLRTSQSERLDFEYTNSLYLLNKPSLFKDETKQFEGIIRGTDDYGRLQIETTSGEIRNYDFKEVSFILNSNSGEMFL